METKPRLRYLAELQRAAKYLGEKHNVIFFGQNAVYSGSRMCETFINQVPLEKRRETPVFENTQLAMSIGLALKGFVPVSIFGRPNFLVYGAGILANQLDKIGVITKGKVTPKVIIKTMNGPVRPIDPGVQHMGDLSEIFQKLTPNYVEVIRLDEPGQIFLAYQKAYERTDGKSTILVEWGDYYNEK